MSRAAIAHDEVAKVADLYQRLGSYQKVADELQAGTSWVQRRVARAGELGLLGTDPVIPGFRIQAISTGYEHGEKTKEWIRQTKDLGEQQAFQLPDGHMIKGVSALLDSDGKVQAQWVKTKTDDNYQDLIDGFEAAFAPYQGQAPTIEAPRLVLTDYLSVYPVVDHHLGMLAWGLETGEPYDLKIACERLHAVAKTLIDQSPASHTALILNLGDWTHIDDSKNATPASGNALDVDSRYYKVVATGVQLMRSIIELALAKHQRVLVRNLPGNHDPHASIALTIALSCFYADDPRVQVIEDPSEFYFHRFGVNLIGAHHGHRAKPADLAMNMAFRCAHDWGQTSYRWFLRGHIHHEVVNEIHGVRVEAFQTLAAKDAWHSASGYNAGQSMQSITLHAHRGEVGRHRVNLPAATIRPTSTAA